MRHHFVFTDQTLLEFKRNRAKRANDLLTGFFPSSPPSNKPVKIGAILAQPGYTDLVAAYEQYMEVYKRFRDKLSASIGLGRDDPLAVSTVQLIESSGGDYYRADVGVIERAQHRQLRGQPPSSSDKRSIGDEIIWETLLANMADDLVIVTKDGSFHENLELLAEEYKDRTTKSLLRVVRLLSEGFDAIGVPVPRVVSQAETEAGLGDLAQTTELEYCSPERLQRLRNRLQAAVAPVHAKLNDLYTRETDCLAQLTAVGLSVERHLPGREELDRRKAAGFPGLPEPIPRELLQDENTRLALENLRYLRDEIREVTQFDNSVGKVLWAHFTNPIDISRHAYELVGTIGGVEQFVERLC